MNYSPAAHLSLAACRSHATRLTCGLALLLGLGRVHAADSAAPPGPVPTPAATATTAAPMAPAPLPGSEKKDAPLPFREQSIYVPYDKLRKVFEKDGRGVFLPYEEFQKLWQAARDSQPAARDLKPPVDNVVAGLFAEATVGKDVVTVKATIRIELLKDGWNRVPLGLQDVAITQALIGDTPARLAAAEDGAGYVLLVLNDTKTPKLLELDLQFAKAYTKTPGRNSVSFAAPAAPVSRWDVRVPEAGVKVELEPLLAATETPAVATANQTRVLAFVGATPTVTIAWTPKAEGAKGLAALASVQAEQQVSIDEGVVRTRTSLAYAISRAELAQVVVEVPANQKITNVFDPNVREWGVVNAGQVQVITAQLFQPAKDAQRLVIELERFADERTVAAPVIKARDVSRQQGVVVVKVAAGLRAEAGKRDNLLQLDAAELPEALAGGKWEFAYRYAALPFELSLNIEKIQPRIIVDALIETTLTPEFLQVEFHSLHDIQDAGVFQLYLRLPAGLEIRYVRGEALGGAAAAEVESHHQVEGKPGLWLVNLSRQARGRVGLAVQLYRKLTEPDLLTPTGKEARITIPLPRADKDSIQRETGRLTVSAPECLRLNVAESPGLRTISYTEALQGLKPPAPGNGDRALAFAYAEETAGLVLSVERRKPQVTVRQLLTARIESGVVKYEAALFYDILYSGVKNLRVDVPKGLAAQIRVTTPGVRQSVFEATEKPEGVDASDLAWKLTGETEFLGTPQIRLAWEQKIDKLDVGSSVEIVVPRLKPAGLDRAWGQIVIAKAESIDVTPTEKRSGLRAIDPQHDLMPGANLGDAARALEFHDDWTLTVKATRYESKDVKATSIERALVQMVVTRGDITSVQAVYRLRSARQRLAIQLPGQVDFDTQPLRLNGRPVPLEKGGEHEYFVPLTAQAQNEPFLLELRYTSRGSGLPLECPTFPQEPASQQLYLAVYLPEELSYLGATGPWNDELVWYINGFSSVPRGNKSNSTLYNWVAQGLLDQAQQNSLASFATDGRQLLFSTLRPPPGEKGQLRVHTVRTVVLQLLLLVLGIGIGLALVPARLPRRALVVGLIFIGLVLLGVFTPSLARAMITNATVGGAVIVFVIWVLWFIVVTRPRAAAEFAAAHPAPPPLPSYLARQAAAKRAAAAAADTPPPAPQTEEPAAAPPATETKPDDSGKGG